MSGIYPPSKKIIGYYRDNRSVGPEIIGLQLKKKKSEMCGKA